MESGQKRKQRILPFTRINKRFIEEKIEMAINIKKKISSISIHRNVSGSILTYQIFKIKKIIIMIPHFGKGTGKCILL